MSNRHLCTAALLGTAAIHLAAVPEHLREWPAAAAFFVVLAVAEGVLACAVLARANRRVLLGGAAVSLASAVLWAVSRTAGLPVGPEAFAPEAVAAPDVISTALEAAAALLLLQLASRRPATVPVRIHP